MAKAALDLAELDLKDLIQELERRLECATKPDKRLVLLGAMLLPSEPRHYGAAETACPFCSGIFDTQLQGFMWTWARLGATRKNVCPDIFIKAGGLITLEMRARSSQ